LYLLTVERRVNWSLYRQSWCSFSFCCES
jgi:hypothetical protein